MFSCNPTEVTNELLQMLILNTLLNSSSVADISLELDKVTELEPDAYHMAITLNTLLFVGLAFAIMTSMRVMMGKLWPIQYISWVHEHCSPYDHVMKRQEAFSGLESWKFHRVINSLHWLPFSFLKCSFSKLPPFFVLHV